MAKKALVTGAGSGIGRAIALGLALLGQEVLLGGRDERKLQAVAAEIAQAGGRARPCAADLSDETQLRGLVDGVLREGDGLDVLVHSAGCFMMGLWASEPVEDLDRMYRIHMRAPYLLTQLLLPTLEERSGQVVFINSSASLMTGPKWGAYSAVKAGLKLLADSLRSEVNPFGVRVVSVFPGRTATPMQERIFGLENRPYGPENLIQPEEVARMVVAALELPHTAEVTDIFVRPTKKLS